jgi:CheY-like chemotaxis protein
MDTVQATGIALREKPRLILTDIGLPGGSGLILLDRLRANVHTNGIPTIVVTAQTKPGLEAMVRAKGAVAFLQKPIEKKVLLLGLPDHFIDHGDPARLLASVGLDAAGLVRSIRTALGDKIAP